MMGFLIRTPSQKTCIGVMQQVYVILCRDVHMPGLSSVFLRHVFAVMGGQSG
jgi:hypothetical protein